MPTVNSKWSEERKELLDRESKTCSLIVVFTPFGGMSEGKRNPRGSLRFEECSHCAPRIGNEIRLCHDNHSPLKVHSRKP